jgi:hypothetical protein
MVSQCAIAADHELVAILCRKWLGGLDYALHERSERKLFELQFHTASFDFWKVKDVIDQRKQMPASAEQSVVIEIVSQIFYELPPDCLLRSGSST